MPNPIRVCRKVVGLFSPQQRALRVYRSLVVKLPVDKHAVLIEQQNGLALDGNMYVLMRELLASSRFDGYTIRFVTTADNDEGFIDELERRGLHVQTVVRGSAAYLRALATSRWLFTDNGFPPYLIKRPTQVLTNTWHGIPLKTLGRREAVDAYRIGNTQRNLALADYLIMPNPLMEERIVRDYMLEGLCDATILPMGYPRNEAFVQTGAKHRANDGNRVYAYLPTFRGVGDNRGMMPDSMGTHLAELDSLLHDDETLYLKLHLVERQRVDMTSYRHIRDLPSDCELYEFLATCDALVTDYSSVMFDVPLGDIKVVLWPYDEQDYVHEHGLYDSLSSLPFPKVSTTSELVRELRAEQRPDYGAQIKTWWPHPTLGASRLLLNRVMGAGAALDGEHEMAHPPKPTVLVYSELGCDLEAFRRELTDLADVYAPRLAFPWACGKGHVGFLNSLPGSVSFTPLMGDILSTLPERAALKIGGAKNALRLDWARTFGEARFNRVIIHDGYNRRWIALLKQDIV